MRKHGKTKTNRFKMAGMKGKAAALFILLEVMEDEDEVGDYHIKEMIRTSKEDYYCILTKIERNTTQSK